MSYKNSRQLKTFAIFAMVLILIDIVFLIQFKRYIVFTNSFLLYGAIISLFGGTVLLIYYLLSNFLFPDWQKSWHYQFFLSIVISSMLSLGINIWKYSVIESQKAIIDFFFSSIKLGMFIFLFVFVLWFIFNLKKTSFLKKLPSIVYAFFLVSLMSCIFATDFFQMAPGQSSVIFEGGTEDYINYRIQNTELSFIEEIQKYKGFNYGIFHDEGAAPQFIVYQSQTGFYGALLKLVYTVSPVSPDDFLMGTRILFCFILAVLLTKLALSIWKKYGVLASLIFSFLSSTTYWIIGPSKHLIWFYFILFIPVIFSIYAYPKYLDNEKSVKWFFTGLLICFIFLFLRGYTYISCLTLSAAIPIVYYQLKQKDYRTMFLHGVYVGIIALLAYILVMGFHFVQLVLLYGNSSDAYSYLLEKALFRVQGSESKPIRLLPLFLSWNNIRFFYFSPFLRSLLPETLKFLLPKNEIFTVYKLLGVDILAVMILFFRIKLKKQSSKDWKCKSVDLLAIAFTCLLSLLASWTWFAAKGHMDAHPHMNGIMFIIPFGLTLFFFTGVIVQTLLEYLFSSEK